MNAAAGLLEGPAPRVRTAPPGADFLGALSRALLAASHEGEFTLDECLVLAPNRRTARALADRLAEDAGRALLLPAIRPLGDLEDDPEVWGPGHVLLAAGASIDPLRRKLELARLLRARDAAEGGVARPASALAAAEELAGLLDAAAAADDPSWDDLPGLVEAPELAAHWRRSAEFLGILAEYWPQRLATDGLLDAAQHRRAVQTALARHWLAYPPAHPVVIAGSTGSLPGVRALMRVVARLPRGVVLLPGLDLDLDDAAWAGVGPQHPQFALKRSIAAMGVARAAVAGLQGAEESASARARRLVLREALAPPEAAADWLQRLEALGGPALAREGTSGLVVYPCATAEQEAMVAALLLRETLETPGQTAALATPSAALARRVVAKLARWNVPVDSSVPEPLADAPIGALLAVLGELAIDDGAPVALAGLFAHPMTRLGLPADTREKGFAALLDEHLRGSRRHRSLGVLAAAAGAAGRAAGAAWEALAPLRSWAESSGTLADYARALAGAAEAVAQHPDEPAPARLWSDGAGAAAGELLRRLIVDGEALGPMRLDEAREAFEAILAAETYRPEPEEGARVRILGALELRLMRADRVVLSGLNEGVWPRRPVEDAFLSRSMRAQLGLPDPDERVGLAAHDFFQAACAPEVLLTRALREDGAPTVASRWLWRLETLLEGAGASVAPDPSTDIRLLAAMLDRPAKAAPVRAPAPRPPAQARLRQLGATDVERLIRDPYALYARRILGLRARRPVGGGLDAAERGQLIHGVLENASRRAARADVPEPDDLLEEIVAALRACGVEGAALAAERVRLVRPAAEFARWLGVRREAVARTFLETPGALALPDEFVLVARADRIDLWADGTAEILDIKTGRIATTPQAASGLAPQLPLEAAILAAGGFEGVGRAEPSGLVYWRFAASEHGPSPLKLDIASACSDATGGLMRLLRAFCAPDAPFRSKPRPQFLADYPEYDHLARRKEWADIEEEGE